MDPNVRGQLEQQARTITRSLEWGGAALVLVGILAILSPLASGVAFDIVFGAAVLAAGVVQLWDAFRSDSWVHATLRVLAALVTLFAGIVFLARPVVGLVVLTLVFIGYLVFDGAFRLAIGLSMARGAQGRGWVIAGGLVSLLLAFIALRAMPGASAWLVGTFVGASLVVSGASRMAVGHGLRHAAEALRGPPFGREAHA